MAKDADVAAMRSEYRAEGILVVGGGGGRDWVTRYAIRLGDGTCLSLAPLAPLAPAERLWMTLDDPEPRTSPVHLSPTSQLQVSLQEQNKQLSSHVAQLRDSGCSP
jgi:hypothetical protein